ncbi:triacylglycerol lipase 2 isoform X2 [Selaginella moellendorffii]|uniref:triacylglycerol lipase 2 isoform X2 n=1 Tax=Selaginella moellendorffii TaxID=88036 RepID=UPI000D1C26AB|nr:triacylglycerol lipase 2 isoform X2 [Selaginella moellendorffii]|eukprot:XP_024542122.1 triacylglycerol lipase 2 isoform X2 [Selaginella moellendorffii]
MKMVLPLLLAACLAVAASAAAPSSSFPNHGKQILRFAEDSFCSTLVLVHGYPCQEFKVTTPDGYILRVHRIPHGVAGVSSPSPKPVFLQHGVLQGGDDWVFYPPRNSLGFVLADEGFDVWIGNLRGTHWSRQHVSYSSGDKAYWDWTWDGHAQYDLPAMLNLVHENTGSELYYVGHSQGTLIALAAFSESKLMNVVRAAVLLSPIAYLKGMTSTLSRLAALLYMDQIYDDVGLSQFTLESGIGAYLLRNLCSLDPRCADLLVLVTGRNCCFNASLTSYYRQFEPQGSSTKNLVHLAQMVRTGLFAKFDYGSSLGNMRAYSQVVPPTYEPANIPKSFPVFLVYGGKDTLSTPQGVQELAKRLVCTQQTLFLPNYAHADFVVGTRARQDVFDPVIKFIKAN